MMATRDKTRADEQAQPSPASVSERVSDRARKSAQPPREAEPLDEKSLEQVMRECPV
jgi:hypothetical protein